MTDAWFDRDPALLQREEDALREAGLPYKRDEVSFARGVARFLVTIESPNGPLDVSATYPDEFPYFPPHVKATQATGLTHHVMPNGAVCLLTPGRWSPATHTLAWLLTSQWPVVLEANEGEGTNAVGELIERDQAEPLSAYVDYSSAAMVILDGSCVIDEADRSGTGVAIIARNDPALFIVTTVADGTGAAFTSDQLYIGDDRPSVPLRWVRIDAAPDEPTATGFWRAAAAADPTLDGDAQSWGLIPGRSGRGNAAAFGPHRQVTIVFFPEETSRRTLGQGCVALIRERKRPRDKPGHAELVRVSRAGRSDLYRRAPQLKSLAARRVMVVGGGGLGAAIHQELGRLGLGRLTIIDGDFVDPAAAVRGASAMRFAGLPKAETLSILASEAQPYTETRHGGWIVGAPRPEVVEMNLDDEARKAIADHDLIVDATADTNVQHYLSDLCRHSGRTYVHAESTRGVWAGLVAAYGPTGLCWMCVQHHLDDGTIPKLPEDPTAVDQPLGCAAPTYLGAGFDLASIATHTVRVVTSVLTGDDGYGVMSGQVFVARLRTADGAPIPIAWQTLSLHVHPACPNPNGH